MIKINGSCKWFNSEKGYGFILGEDGEEYFVHVSSLPDKTESLMDSQKVTFEPEEGERGKVAKSIILEV